MMEQEGDLEFDFSKATVVEKLDRQATRQPEGMQLVDFVVEEARRLIMVEIKDPSCKPQRDTPAAQDALGRSRADFSRKIQNDSLIANELVPKGRDTYSYWARQYVTDCIVLTEKTWPLAFPQFPMKRLR